MNNILACVICALVGIIIGYIIGRYVKNAAIKTLYDYLSDVFKNLDNYVMTVSALIVIVSIVLSVVGKIETFASVTINIFGTIVFSWLLTKKSAKVEFKEQEQDLSMCAYRHINYLESAANSAYKTLKDFSDDEGINKEVKLMLSNAMSQIKYIQGGINTCKMDWVDMLSPEQQSKCNIEKNAQDDEEDFGTVDVVVGPEECNQEDA